MCQYALKILSFLTILTTSMLIIFFLNGNGACSGFALLCEAQLKWYRDYQGQIS